MAENIKESFNHPSPEVATDIETSGKKKSDMSDWQTAILKSVPMGRSVSVDKAKVIREKPIFPSAFAASKKKTSNPSKVSPDIFDEDIAAIEDISEAIKPFNIPSAAPMPQGVQVQMMAADIVQPKFNSLKSFIDSGIDIDGSEWTPPRISDALTAESWRARDIDETIREGDILAIGDGAFDRVQGYKDLVITSELVELHNLTVFTLEGGGKKQKPRFTKTTNDFENMFAVPKDEQLKLPTNEKEAERFFGCEVVATEISDRGRPVKFFVPIQNMMADRNFRRTFSRIFVDFAKRQLRDNIKGLIYGRGEGIRLPKKISTKQIIRSYQDLRDFPVKERLEKISTMFHVPSHFIADLLVRYNYGCHDDNNPLAGFMERMDARSLTPQDFRYEKGLGIEIETVCPMSAKDAQTKMPNYVRVVYDGSLRNENGEKMSHNNGNSPAELAAGRNGQWGVEFCILIKRSELETRLLRVLESISKLGCRVNKSCGLHIHFDMRNRKFNEVEEIHEHLTRWLSALRDLLPVSRRANQYCAFENPDNQHHAAVSLDAFKRHQTLEVRVHSSTLNNIKIIQWIRLIEHIMETKFAPYPKISCLDALKSLRLTEADNTYWLKRHQQLNPKLYKEGKLDLGFLGENPHEDE